MHLCSHTVCLHTTEQRSCPRGLLEHGARGEQAGSSQSTKPSLLQAHFLPAAISHAAHRGQSLVMHYTFAENPYAEEKAAPNPSLGSGLM